MAKCKLCDDFGAVYYEFRGLKVITDCECLTRDDRFDDDDWDDDFDSEPYDNEYNPNFSSDDIPF